MNLHLSEIVFAAGFVAYVVIRGVFIERAKANEKVLARGGGPERPLLLLVFVGNLLLPVVYLATPWLRFADVRLPVVAWSAGIAVLAAALLLFWRAHSDLGVNWSQTLELRKGHQLVTSGVYRRVRHPMYAAIFLFGLAQGLLLHNWLAGWAALATFAPLYLVRVPREECMMLEFFGEAYRDYTRRTRRLW
jgi:protein-S-isoprenylcysteine O-methyltransferase Ste14